MRLMLAGCLWASLTGGLAQSNLYLPPVHEGEQEQTCLLPVAGLDNGTLLKVSHPCFVRMASDRVVVSNRIARLAFTIDLTEAADRFHLVLWEEDQSRARKQVTCHLSKVPFRLQTVVQGDRFAITNLTTAPLVIEQQQGTALLEANARWIRGTFKAGAFLVLQGHGRITLKDL